MQQRSLRSVRSREPGAEYMREAVEVLRPRTDEPASCGAYGTADGQTSASSSSRFRPFREAPWYRAQSTFAAA